MKPRYLILCVLWSLMALPCLGQRTHHYSTHHYTIHSYVHHYSGGYGAGPNDISRAHDYARHIGSPYAHRLSTGWTSGHGSRIYQTHDYYRHTHSGSTIHVHGYYHSRRH